MDDFSKESFRSDALAAIEEYEKEHENSYKLYIPEGVSIHQEKENSWEPSVFNGSIAPRQDASVLQSTPIASHRSQGRGRSRLFNAISPIKDEPEPAEQETRNSVIATDSFIAKIVDGGDGAINASRFLDSVRRRKTAGAERVLQEVPIERAVDFGSSSASLGTRPSSRSSVSSNVRQISSVRTDSAKPIVTLRRLFFPFVNVGDKVQEALDIENTTDGHLTVRAHLAIGASVNVFALDTNQLSIPPKEKGRVMVSFCPRDHAKYTGNIELSVVNVVYNRKVRLNGHGGVAAVQPVTERSLGRTREGYYVLTTSNQSVVTLKLKNCGARSAYVKMRIAGMHDDEELPGYSMNPSQGVVIGSNNTEDVKIQAKNASTPIGNIRLLVYWGEEKMRQRFKAYEATRNTDYLYDNMSFTKTSFNCESETNAVKDPCHDDKTNFFKTLRKLDIHIQNSRISASRASLVDDSHATMMTTFDNLTLSPGTSVVYDRTSVPSHSRRYGNK
ncbi:hypothetical protein L596_010923 [Steinernema carpocapsae]|uniref:Abnormal spindle-like microcephaly-associated protein ASH domain-containing protein n=1 Tax=Steinernema carpocapsae TaxID=34508 RepID=A0A4U5PJZ2_STECR|nr:hypothetical protein L596_010923 [Steinernema carpocapsae]